MRRLLVLTMATACLGGCSCKGTPGQSSSANTAGPTAQRVQAPPPAVQAPLAPPEPTAFDKAAELHAQGRRSGEAGNFQEALKHFQAARELAPEWPLPVYDSGYTYLLMGDAARALEHYQQVDKLAPQGFSDTRRVLACLGLEKAGRVPKGTFRKFLDVMRARDEQELRRQLEELTRTAPRFYPAWKELIFFEKELDAQERLLKKTLALSPDADTRGELRIYEATLLRRRGKDEEARKLLQSLVDDPQSPPTTVTEAREALSITLAP